MLVSGSVHGQLPFYLHFLILEIDFSWSVPSDEVPLQPFSPLKKVGHELIRKDRSYASLRYSLFQVTCLQNTLLGGSSQLGYVVNNHGMVIVSPLSRVVGPFPNGLFMANKWG